MNSFATMGYNTFMEGVEGGMPPTEAAEAAGSAMGTAATDMGFPADMVADGVASGMAAFTDALANGMSPTDAFSVAVADVPRLWLKLLIRVRWRQCRQRPWQVWTLP